MAETIHITRDNLAVEISNLWDQWNKNRSTWLDEKKELRQFLFATDTRKTSVNKLPWKNSTVTPKLTQIRDNLHANYMAALFPNDDWLVWEADTEDSATKEKREIIENYMRTKLRQSDFELLVSQLIYDYIDFGNVIAGAEYVSETNKDEEDQDIVKYAGPRAFRVSPIDCVFDPLAPNFHSSPFIRRIVKTIGDFKKDVLSKPEWNDMNIVSNVIKDRQVVFDTPDYYKSAGFEVDGFGSLTSYMQSGMVELLEFWGDIYDVKTDTLMLNQVITVVDRRYVLRQITNPSWLGKRPFEHVGWRLRQDNLWAQGPLDQLIGMQYRIDHLENLKADVFDQIAHPVIKVKGNTVEDFDFGPGVIIHLGDDGDVIIDRPDAGALTANFEIAELMNKMEELAGAPKQAMGIRTPGEKTKYEVQALENGAGRIFQAKVNWFERNIIEPLVNTMLELARRNLNGFDQVKVIDEYGIENFLKIQPSDLKAAGKLRPIGARHFAAQAKFVQEFTTTMQAVQAMPTVAVHFSGKSIAYLIEETFGWKKYALVKDNAAVMEQKETQSLVNAAQEGLEGEAAMPTELQPGDYME